MSPPAQAWAPPAEAFAPPWSPPPEALLSRDDELQRRAVGLLHELRTPPPPTWQPPAEAMTVIPAAAAHEAQAAAPVPPWSPPDSAFSPEAPSGVQRIITAGKEGFGPEPLGPSEQTLAVARKFGPVVEQAVRSAGTAGDMVLRGLEALTRGGAAAVAEVAKVAGLDATQASQLERDVYGLAQMAQVAAPLAAPTGIVTPRAVMPRAVPVARTAAEEVAAGETRAAREGVGAREAPPAPEAPPVPEAAPAPVPGAPGAPPIPFIPEHAAKMTAAAEDFATVRPHALAEAPLRQHGGTDMVMLRDGKLKDIEQAHVTFLENALDTGIPSDAAKDQLFASSGIARVVASPGHVDVHLPSRATPQQIGTVDALFAANKDKKIHVQFGHDERNYATDAAAGFRAKAREHLTPPFRTQEPGTRGQEASKKSPAPSRPLPKYAGAPEPGANINLQRIEAPEEIKAVIDRVAREHAPQIDETRRYRISHDATAEMADHLGMTHEDLLKHPVGRAMNAEQAVAARNILVKHTDDVVAAAKAAKLEPSEANLAALQQVLLTQRAIQEAVSGATAEAGRALSSFNIMARGGGRMRADALRKLVEDGGGPEQLHDLAGLLASLDDPVQVSRMVAASAKPSTADKVYFAWINALLSGPKTHIANITGNALTAVHSIAESAVAEMLPGRGVRLGETAARTYGTVKGLGEGVLAGAKAFVHGEGASARASEGALRHEMLPGKKGMLAAPTRALAAEDAVFRSIAYRSELNAQAWRQARNEGKGIARAKELAANPSDAMMRAASEHASYQTFQKEPGELGRKAQGFVRGFNLGPIPAGRMILPFFRTPLNLLKYAGERTPLAVLHPKVFRALRGLDGRVAQQQAISRIVVGSGLIGTVAHFADQGLVTGSGPSDPAERRLWLVDHQPNSVKIGDRWVSYGRLEPFATIAGTVATLVEGRKAGTISSSDAATRITGLMVSLLKNLGDKTFLSGPIQAAAAISDPERYGEQWLQGMAGSVIPRAVTTIAEARDPMVREPRGFVESLMQRIPGDWQYGREALPLRIDAFGRPTEREAIGPEAVSPLSTRSAVEDPLARELLRLHVTPGKPSRKISVAGRDVELSGEAYQLLQQVGGGGLATMGRNLLALPGYQRLPDEAKILLLEKLGSVSRQAGRMRAEIETRQGR